jgi:peptide/nickel transport system ATP-binding protein
MIFQDPYASLNPRWTVGDIVAEPICAHELVSTREAVARVGELLTQVGLAPRDREKVSAPVLRRPAAADLDRARAREQSRVPRLRRADVGARRVGAGAGAQPDEGPAARAQLTYLFISHNLAVVRHISDRVGVMYLGRVVELAEKRAMFAMPQHPYSRMLLDAVPDLAMTGKPRTPVAGEVPNPLNPPTGCTFHPRCPFANERCRGGDSGAAGVTERRRGRLSRGRGGPGSRSLFFASSAAW